MHIASIFTFQRTNEAVKTIFKRFFRRGFWLKRSRFSIDFRRGFSFR